MHYELQPKRQQPRNRERKVDKIHDVKLASTNTQFQETQRQRTSNIHKHIQNQEQQCLQSIDFYQDAINFVRSNQSNSRNEQQSLQFYSQRTRPNTTKLHQPN